MTPREIRLYNELPIGVIGASNDAVVSDLVVVEAVLPLDFSGGESC